MGEALDGFGWLVDKHCRLCSAYGWSPEFCWEGITSAAGWVYYNWARENEATLLGAVVERRGDGYIRQAAKQLMKRKKAKQN